MMKGEVLEAPAAKIVVAPRRVILAESERSTGKKQTFSITNEGSLPLIITDIKSKDGKTVYYDGAQSGNITIEPSQKKTLELQLPGNAGDQQVQEYILIHSNAKNAGASGIFIMIQYSAP
jgi:hypothetical protein